MTESGEAARAVTICCGGTLGLSDPSGSCLRVMSHDVRCVVGVRIYSGLYGPHQYQSEHDCDAVDHCCDQDGSVGGSH